MRSKAVFAVACLLLAAGGTVLAQDSPSITMSADGTLVTVLDPGRNALLLYRVAAGGNTVNLIGSRDLIQDIGTRTGGPAATEAAPTSDAPGQDPPGFRKPKGAVRTGSTMDRTRDSNRSWQARYLMPGTVSAVYASIRGSVPEESLLYERFGAGGESGELNFRHGDKAEVQVRLGKAAKPAGWVVLDVTQTER